MLTAAHVWCCCEAEVVPHSSVSAHMTTYQSAHNCPEGQFPAGLLKSSQDTDTLRHPVLLMCSRSTLHDYRERKNVNLPGVVVDLPTLTKKDEDDLVNWGVPNDIDFIAASFVRKGLDLDNIRKVCIACFRSAERTIPS